MSQLLRCLATSSPSGLFGTSCFSYVFSDHILFCLPAIAMRFATAAISLAKEGGNITHAFLRTVVLLLRFCHTRLQDHSRSVSSHRPTFAQRQQRGLHHTNPGLPWTQRCDARSQQLSVKTTAFATESVFTREFTRFRTVTVPGYLMMELT